MGSGYEVAMRDVIPAVRYALIKELKIKYNKKEAEIAKSLEITQAAISKYLSGKVSSRIKEIEARLDKSLIDKYAESIALGNGNNVNLCICGICKSINDFGCKFSYAKEAATV